MIRIPSLLAFCAIPAALADYSIPVIPTQVSHLTNLQTFTNLKSFTTYFVTPSVFTAIPVQTHVIPFTSILKVIEKSIEVDFEAVTKTIILPTKTITSYLGTVTQGIKTIIAIETKYAKCKSLTVVSLRLRSENFQIWLPYRCIDAC